MPDAVSATPIPGLKLHPPSCPRDLVVRHRLLDRLDEATRGRCTLIAAGPGFGKSMLLSSWVGQQNQFSRVAWLTLDAADANPRRLVAHLVAALQEPFRASEDTTSPLMGLRPPPASAGQTYVGDALLPALESVDEPLVLVIDDAHHLSSSPAAIAGLNLLLRWAPPSLRLVLSGRYDPPLALQRLRLAGQLTTLRQHELACNEAESRAVLASSGLQLSPDDAEALHDLTQGWPAALRLAALSLLDLGAAPAFLERFVAGDVALADYLTSEVLQGLAPDLRAFVLRATIDRHVCGALVDAVLGGNDGDALLADCERRNLFLTRVSHEQQQWYAWHQMFVDQMQRRLEAENPDAARQAHLDAARWWRDREPARAAGHAIDGGEGTLAAEIVAESWVGLALAGDSRALLELLEVVPPEPPYAAELRLAACYAHLLEAEPRRAEAYLHEAVSARNHVRPELLWRFDARVAWLRLLLADKHAALADVLADARRVLHDAPVEAMFDDDPTYALASLAVGMAEARLQENVRDAIELLHTAAEAGRRHGLDVLELMARAELCVPRITEGDLTQVEKEAEAILDAADNRGWRRFGPLAQPVGYLGWLAYWRGDLPTARDHLERAVDICPVSDWHRGLIVYFHGRTLLAGGEVTAAEADLAELRELAASGCLPPDAPSVLASLEAEILAAHGRLEEALGVVTGTQGAENRMTRATRATLLRRSGRHEEALRVLEHLDDPYPQIVLVRQLLSALTMQDLGRQEAAHIALERALAAAEPASLMGPFLAAADEIGPLLDSHIRRGTAHEPFATRVTARLAGDVEQVGTGRHERLTERELDILRYLRTSMPNAEIADQLFVSVNTVKTHAAAIYRKLGVSGRREAVHRAEALGLFGYSVTEVPAQHPAGVTRQRQLQA